MKDEDAVCIVSYRISAGRNEIVDGIEHIPVDLDDPDAFCIDGVLYHRNATENLRN